MPKLNSPGAAVPLYAAFAVSAALAASAAVQQPGTLVVATTASVSQLREWDHRIDAMVHSGELRLRQVRNDTLVTGRVH